MGKGEGMALRDYRIAPLSYRSPILHCGGIKISPLHKPQGPFMGLEAKLPHSSLDGMGR